MLLGINNHFHIYYQIVVIIGYILHTVISVLNLNVSFTWTILLNHCGMVCIVCKTRHILFPFTPSPLSETWSASPLPPPSTHEVSEAQGREGACLRSHCRQMTAFWQAAPCSTLLIPWNCISLSVWGILVVINLLCLLWPISKRGLSRAKRSRLYFFASKFFLFSGLEKVARRPTQ